MPILAPAVACLLLTRPVLEGQDLLSHPAAVATVTPAIPQALLAVVAHPLPVVEDPLVVDQVVVVPTFPLVVADPAAVVAPVSPLAVAVPVGAVMVAVSPPPLLLPPLVTSHGG